MNDTTIETDKQTVEQELIAMRKISKLLMELDANARRRVFGWLSDYHDLDNRNNPSLGAPQLKVLSFEENDEPDPN